MENIVAKQLFLVTALFLGAIANPGSVIAQGNVSAIQSQVLNDMHKTNLTEIEAGLLAQKNGQSAEVRKFGKQLVSDHKDSDQKVMKIARSQHINLAKSIPQDEMHKKEMKQLRSTDKTEFDGQFAQMMLQGHMNAIQKLTDYQNQINAGPVKDLIVQTLPVLRQHEQIATNINERLNPGTRAPASGEQDKDKDKDENNKMNDKGGVDQRQTY